MAKSTQELLDILKQTANAPLFLEKEADELCREVTVSDCLEDLLETHRLVKSSVIRKSGLDKGYAYDIFSGKKHPSRDKLLRLCFAMELSFEEVQALLKRTAYPQLYAKLERDSILIFALQQGYSVIDTNELLYEMEYEPLE